MFTAASMKARQRVFRLSLILVPITVGLSALGGKAWWNALTAPPQSTVASTAQTTPKVPFQVPQGTAAQAIGRDLEAAGLIRSTEAWNLWARWLQLRHPQGGFKAGNYELSSNQPLPEIAEIIWNGKVVERSFTIPEGWSLQQMANYFQEQGFFSAAEFMSAVNQVDRSQFPWLPADLPQLEGFLYPDTYKLSADGIKPKTIVRQMLKQFEQVALPLYEQASNQTSLSLLEWVTLASIVEKEAVVPDERSRIAGVFTQRLRQGIPLGADPTVEYALGIRQTVDQPLTLNQVKTDSPYNTYVNAGLPPTPIASPGYASLKATLEPEDTPYLYFVARYDGTHVFSRTLAEHEAAIAAIRQQQSTQ